MPRLWNATVDEHRRTVHAAILDATAALVAEHGMAGVTMSRIAEEVGIGRATLYKYFADVETIMVAWHERLVTDHLRQLAEAAARVTNPGERLTVVLQTYAELSGGNRGHGHGHSDSLAVAMHRAKHMHRAHQELHGMVSEVIAAAAKAGAVRSDVPPQELATYCLNALAAAGQLASKAARDRLVTVTLAGLKPPG